MAHGEHEGRRGRSDGCQELAARAGAQLPCEKRDKDDDDRDDQRGDDPQSSRRLAEDRLADPAEERRQRPLIVVAGSRMAGRGAEVELVAVVAVAVRERELQEQLHRSDGEHEPRSERPAIRHRQRSRAPSRRSTSSSSLYGPIETRSRRRPAHS